MDSKNVKTIRQFPLKKSLAAKTWKFQVFRPTFFAAPIQGGRVAHPSAKDKSVA